MATDEFVDYYEALQISASAQPETIRRVYRLLAQQLHPDNSESGNAAQFRQLTEAYQVLSDPERRAQYDIVHARARQGRWRLISNGIESENDFGSEQRFRLTALEVLYTRRRTEPDSPGMSPLDLSSLIGLTREQMEFTVWYLVQKKFVTRSDNSLLTITVDGAEYLEGNYRETLRRRLNAAPSAASA